MVTISRLNFERGRRDSDRDKRPSSARWVLSRIIDANVRADAHVGADAEHATSNQPNVRLTKTDPNDLHSSTERVLTSVRIDDSTFPIVPCRSLVAPNANAALHDVGEIKRPSSLTATAEFKMYELAHDIRDIQRCSSRSASRTAAAEFKLHGRAHDIGEIKRRSSRTVTAQFEFDVRAHVGADSHMRPL